MIHMNPNRLIVSLILALAFLFPSAASAQRDFLTPDEVELVREAQEVDLRIGVLTQAIDRRFGVMNINSGGTKPKKSGNWGELPQGTRSELFLDIRRLLQKAIDDIDNLAERPDSMVVAEPEKGKKPKGYSDIFPKAVRSLAAAAARYKAVLEIELDKSTDNSDKGSILSSLELCDQILAAVVKLPAEVKKEKN